MRKFKTFKDCYWSEDTKRIALALATEGYFLTPAEAEKLWEDYSEEVCANWLCLPKDEGELKETLIMIVEGSDNND